MHRWERLCKGYISNFAAFALGAARCANTELIQPQAKTTRQQSRSNYNSESHASMFNFQSVFSIGYNNKAASFQLWENQKVTVP